MKQWKDQTKWSDIFILFEIQIKKKLWKKGFLKIKAKVIKKIGIPKKWDPEPSSEIRDLEL